MSLTFKNKDLYFTKDLTQYVAKEDFSVKVEVSFILTNYIARVSQLPEASEKIKASASTLLTFLNANSNTGGHNYYGEYFNKHTPDQFNNLVFNKPLSTIDSVLQKLAALEVGEVSASYMPYYEVSSTNFGDRYNHKTSYEVEKEKKNLDFTQSLSLFEGKIKVPVLAPSSELSDDTYNTVHEPLTPHLKIGKALAHLKTIIDFAAPYTENNEQNQALVPWSYNLRLAVPPNTSKEAQKAFSTEVANTPELKNFHTNGLIAKENPKKVWDDLNKLYKNMEVVYNELLEKTMDFSSFIKKPWTGSLNEEDIFNFGKAFYIIGVSQGVEGFVGLKSVYNRGQSNSYTYTVVKDIKNATMFTEGATYNLGYGLQETERLYVDMEFKHLTAQNSQLSQKLQSFITKNKIKDILPALVEVPAEEVAVKKPSRNRI